MFHTYDDWEAAMRAAPDNAGIMGLFADWCDENDLPRHAEALRFLWERGKVGIATGYYWGFTRAGSRDSVQVNNHWLSASLSSQFSGRDDEARDCYDQIGHRMLLIEAYAEAEPGESKDWLRNE